MTTLMSSASRLCRALSVLLLVHAPLRACEAGAGTAAAVESSCICRAFLIDDAIKAASKEGVVILTGIVHEPLHNQLAQHTVEGLPGVRCVINSMVVEAQAAKN